MGIDAAIAAIVNDIPAGSYFDSHYVILKLKNEHEDVYNEYVSTHGGVANLAGAHGQLGILINNKIDGVTKVEPGSSYSYSTNGKECSCALFLKS